MSLKLINRILLPMVVIAVCCAIGQYIMDQAPEPKRWNPPKAKLTVDAVRLERQDYQVVLKSRGTIRPRTESTLIPEVSGRVVKVSPEFRDGGFFEEGDILLEIDPRNYEAALTVSKSQLAKAKFGLETEKIQAKNKAVEVTLANAAFSKARLAYEEEKIRSINKEAMVIVAKSDLTKAQLALEQAKLGEEDKQADVTVAKSRHIKATLAVEEEKIGTKTRQAAVIITKSDLAKAKLTLEEEKARSKQALENWKKLGNSKSPGDLVLRKPQLEAAKATVAAAEAHIEQKELDLKLTVPRSKTADAEVTEAQAYLRQRELDLSLVGTQLEAAKAAVAAAAALLKQKKLDLSLVKPQIETAGATVAAAQAQFSQRETDLDLVEPQIETARASLAAAEALLKMKEFDLERTKIRALYAGRVLKRNADIGQYVSPGTVLARIYAIDYAEIRLPLSFRQLEFVNIPELYRGESVGEREEGPSVTLKAQIGRRTFKWSGRIVRSESAIDVKSRQLFVIGLVNDPYGKSAVNSDRPPLKVGMFVEADIVGVELKGVFVFSRQALREEDHVLLVDDSNHLVRRKVDILWSTEEQVVVKGELQTGEILCLTPLTFAGDRLEVHARIERDKDRKP